MSTIKYQSNITKEEINTFPLKSFDGEIVLIDQVDQVLDAVNDIRQFTHIGIDNEAKPAFKKGEINEVALIQIAIPDKVYLFRTNKVGLPQDLVDVFEDESIVKIGLALKDDLKDMRRRSFFIAKSFLDLQKFVKAFHIEANGLRKLVAIILGFRISKSAQVSNWEADELDVSQIKYAATDAWVCLEIYNALQKSI